MSSHMQPHLRLEDQARDTIGRDVEDRNADHLHEWCLCCRNDAFTGVSVRARLGNMWDAAT